MTTLSSSYNTNLTRIITRVTMEIVIDIGLDYSYRLSVHYIGYV